MTSTTNNNIDLITALKELESFLKVHLSVTSIFREASKQEINEFLHTTHEGIYEDAWNSLVSNINTLSSVKYGKDENNSTKKVVNCVETISEAIKEDSSFPKEIFQTDENKVILINTASMVNLFGVNCVIYDDISQFVNDSLDIIA